MFQFSIPVIDWPSVLPIIFVALTGMLALVVEMLTAKRHNGFVVAVSLIGLAGTAGYLIDQLGMASVESAGGMVVRDQFGLVMELLLLLAAFLCILFSDSYLREKRVAFGEFYPLLLWSTVGGMVMATSKNLLVIFLGLEVLSIALYVMAGMSRSEEKSEESALKYFLLGAFASGFLLYGIAFVYGATGSLYLPDLGTAWTHSTGATHGLLLFGLGMILIGLGFKTSFVPFHQWTPDVYQGAPTNVTAFMAAGAKIGAFAALWRVLDGCLPLVDLWMPALFWIAILTMTVGNLIAVVQKDVKRILAYSSIAHAGYILVAILAHFKAPDKIGATTVTYYLLSYTLMTVGAFAVVSLSARKGSEDTSLQSLNGLRKRSPLAAAALTLFMLSLIGMPPTAGFFGKTMIFMDALNAGLMPLAIVLAVNSVISIYYYLGIVVASMVSEDKDNVAVATPLHRGPAGATLLCSLGIIAIAIFLSPLGNLLAAR